MDSHLVLKTFPVGGVGGEKLKSAAAGAWAELGKMEMFPN